MNKITSVSTVCVCCLEEAVLETREECAKLKKIEKEETSFATPPTAPS